jgi:hypothetical protein
MKLLSSFESKFETFINRVSMKTRILFIVLFPVFWLTLSTSIEFKDVAEAGEEGELKVIQMIAVDIKSLIASEFFERYRDMKSLALNTALLSDSREERERVLNSFVKLYKDYDLVSFVDLEGRVKAINTFSNQNYNIDVDGIYSENFSKEEWFQNVIKGKFTEDKEKGLIGVFFEDAHRSEKMERFLNAKTHLTTGFSAPVKNNDGKIIGVLHGEANFSWVESKLLHVYSNMVKDGMKTGHISIFIKNNKLLSDLDVH